MSSSSVRALGLWLVDDHLPLARRILGLVVLLCIFLWRRGFLELRLAVGCPSGRVRHIVGGCSSELGSFRIFSKTVFLIFS